MKTAKKSENLVDLESAISQAPGNGMSGEKSPSNAVSSSLSRRATGPRTRQGKEISRRNALKHGIYSGRVLLKGESRAEYKGLFDGFVEAFMPEGKFEQVLVEEMVVNRWRKRRELQAEVGEIRKAVDFMQWEQQTREQEEAHDIRRSLHFQGGLISRMDNPLILKRCLEFLADLRRQFAENGFTEDDESILRNLYGDVDRSTRGPTLYLSYSAWLYLSKISEEKRIEQGTKSPEQCKSNVLEAINREIRRLKKYQKARTAIESARMEVEALRRAVPDSPALDRLLRYGASLDRAFDRLLSQLERAQRMRRGQPVSPRIDVNLSTS
jgi:hypothetical protein